MRTWEQFQSDRLASVPLAPVVLAEPLPLEALPTPALVIDLDVLDANLAKMAAHTARNGLQLRAHTKMHKSPILAQRQLAAGAVGVCAATVSEAEVMLAGGLTNILVTSPIVTDDKIARLVALACRSQDIHLVVDSVKGVDALNAAASAAGTQVKVLVDLDPGMGRTGVAPGAPALALGQHIVNDCGALVFTGLQMYIGNCMHISGFDKRREKYARLLQAGAETRTLFEAAGIAVPVFTGGGTGTFDIEPELGILTEIQAGSYAFMDVEYQAIGGRDREVFDDFDAALFVLVTAISQPQSQLITVDAGLKSFASDSVTPVFRDVEGLVYHWGGDEHGIVALNNPSRSVALADKLLMTTPHCDPTVNLYDYYYPFRQGMVEEVWPVSARGCSE